MAATHIDRMWCVGHDVGYNTRRRILRDVAATHIVRMWCVGHNVGYNTRRRGSMDRGRYTLVL